MADGSSRPWLPLGLAVLASVGGCRGSDQDGPQGSGPDLATTEAPTTATPELPATTDTSTVSTSDEPPDAPEEWLVYGLSAEVGLSALDSSSLEASPLFAAQSEGGQRGQISQVSSERFIVSTGVESSGFVPCDAEVRRVDGGIRTATLGGHYAGAYSPTHDLVAAIRLGEYYTESQCVGEALTVLDQDLQTVFEIDLSAEDGIPPVFRSVAWTESGTLLVVLDQVFDHVDKYAAWRSDLLVYNLSPDGLTLDSIRRPPVEEVWTSVSTSADEVILVSSSESTSLVRRVAFDSFESAFREGADWESVGTPRSFDGFVFCAIGSPDGHLLVSVLGETPTEDATISTQAGSRVTNAVSGLAPG